LTSQPDPERKCPGAKYTINEAVCHARRRRGYPPCQECPHSGLASEKPAVIPAAAEIGPDDRLKQLFTSDPERGSELLGKYPDLLDENLAWLIGFGAGQFFRSQIAPRVQADPSAVSLLVGRDTRPGAAVLARALIEGILAGGTHVVDAGLLDWPQLCFGVRHLLRPGSGGILISGSFEDWTYSGVHLCGNQGHYLPPDRLDDLRILAANARRESVLTRGRFIRCKSPVRVVVDVANGPIGSALPALLAGSELNLTLLNADPLASPPHGPDPANRENLEPLRAEVVRRKAALGLALDSDADRCAFVDAQGRTLPPETVCTLLIRELARREDAEIGVVADQGLALENLEKCGARVSTAEPGVIAVQQTMIDREATLGVTPEGQYLFRDNFYAPSPLIALAILTSSPAPVDGE